MALSAITPRVIQLGILRFEGNGTHSAEELQALGENVTAVQKYRYTGWNDQVLPRLQVERISDRVLRFTIPPIPSYDILKGGARSHCHRSGARTLAQPAGGASVASLCSLREHECTARC